jgi:hypothetical protein
MIITNAELYELEVLLNHQLENAVFEPMSYDKENSIVFVTDEVLKKLIGYVYPKDHKISDDAVLIDFFLFKILQSRYFRNNITVEVDVSNFAKRNQKETENKLNNPQ